jgi:hypothetical protein
MFTIPADGLTDITSYLTTLVGDLWPLIALVIGIPLAFFIINKVISTVKKHTR